MKIFDPWVLIEAGEYEKAAQIYLQRFEENHDSSHLRNGGLALMLLRNYSGALACFEKIVHLEGRRFQSAGIHIDAGICCWCMGHPSTAVDWWKKSRSTPYTDAAGGIIPLGILLFASLRMGDEKLQNVINVALDKIWRKHNSYVAFVTSKSNHVNVGEMNLSNWPGAIVPFLLGKLSYADLNKLADNTNSQRLRERRQCQIHFYHALNFLQQKDVLSYQQGISQCATIKNAFLEHEFHLAQWENDHF